MTTPTDTPAVIPGPGRNGSGPPARSNGAGLPGGFEPFTPPGVPETSSSYLELLPGIYHESDFMARFLLIFEHILSPIERTVGNIADYLEPGLTPADFVPWLGSWLGVVVDARVPDERKRELVRQAPELYRWRGTKRGLAHYLRLYTGYEPEIIEPALSEIASNRNLAFRFTVRIRVPRGEQIHRALVESIIDSEKPAFAACTLEILEG